MTTLTTKAVEGIEDASTRDAGRAKNLFALGRAVVAVRAPDRRHQALDRAEVRAAARPSLQANLAAFNAGWSFGETTELLDVQYRVKPATDVAPGTYRNVNGTTALSLGLIAASVRSGLPLLLASYPITPASELLHELSRHAALRRARRSRPRTRSPPPGWRSAPRSAAASASPRRAAPAWT